MLSLAVPPKARTLSSIVLGIASAATLASPAHAVQLQQDFAGVYAPDRWTFTANGGDGSVNTAAAPASITLTGNDNGSGGIFTNHTINVGASGLVSFNWAYSTVDSFFDQFGYLLNGNFNFLSTLDGESGATSFSVVAGDVFGFSIDGNDGIFGPGNATISNFSAPVPGPLPLLGVGAAFGYSRRLRRRINLSTGPLSSASGSSDQL